MTTGQQIALHLIGAVTTALVTYAVWVSWEIRRDEKRERRRAADAEWSRLLDAVDHSDWAETLTPTTDTPIADAVAASLAHAEAARDLTDERIEAWLRGAG